MTFPAIVVTAVLLLLLSFVGYWIVAFLRNPYQSFGRNDKGGSALGGALQDLDRLIARPSVEHRIEVEQTVHKRDDDIGGE